ncbi:MAG: hypothetical protein RLZZ182_774 [Pseudomonadota bacterium]
MSLLPRRACLRRLATTGLASSGLLVAPWSAFAAPPQGRADRQALVIGNGDYPGAALRNARADAQLMASTLQGLGFQVRLQQDLGLQPMLDQILAFLQASSQSAVRFIYFSGHGAQYRGRNYLLPVDVALKSEDDLPARAVDGTALIERVSGMAQGVNLLVFDACRTPPTRARTRSLESKPEGMGPVVAPSGTLVAFSTAPNRVASDGPDRANSLYTQALAEELRKPGVPIEAVFKRVRTAVAQGSGGQQVPWESSSLVGELCFNGTGALACDAPDPRGRVVKLR